MIELKAVLDLLIFFLKKISDKKVFNRYSQKKEKF